MGADLDQQYLAAGLVDEIRIHLVDVLLGGGRRLFDVLPQRVDLDLTKLSQTGMSRISTAASPDSQVGVAAELRYARMPWAS